MRRGKGRRRAARVALMLAMLAFVFGGIAVGIMHSYALEDFVWTLAPHR